MWTRLSGSKMSRSGICRIVEVREVIDFKERGLDRLRIVGTDTWAGRPGRCREAGRARSNTPDPLAERRNCQWAAAACRAEPWSSRTRCTHNPCWQRCRVRRRIRNRVRRCGTGRGRRRRGFRWGRCGRRKPRQRSRCAREHQHRRNRYSLAQPSRSTGTSLSLNLRRARVVAWRPAMTR